MNNDDDQGSIDIAIGHGPNIVKIVFPALVAWLAFNPEEALELANELIQAAQKAREKAGSIIVVNKQLDS